MKYLSMKKMLATVLTLSAISPLAAHSDGGDSAGTRGGGDVVACYDRQGVLQSVELFDYFEAAETTRLKLDLEKHGPTYLEIVESVLRKVATLDPERGEHYRQNFETFKNSTSFLRRSLIREISDSNEMIDPARNCYKIQAAVQREPKEHQNYFLIDQSLWNKMHEEHKAGLVLHEIIYKDELKSGATHSDGVRLFNAFISSESCDPRDPKGYVKTLSQNLIRKELKSGPYTILADQPTDFWPNGSLKEFKSKTPTTHRLAPSFSLSDDLVCSQKHSVTLYPSGALKACTVPESHVRFQIQGVSTAGAAKASFHPSGMPDYDLETWTGFKSPLMKTVTGTWLKIKPSYTFKVNPEGLITLVKSKSDVVYNAQQ